MATVETAPPPKAGASIIIQIAVLLLMTAGAIGVGWLSGTYLNDTTPQGAATEEAASGGHEVGAAAGHGEEAEGEEGTKPTNPLLLDLGTITTNLAAPSDTWMRMELSVVLNQPTEDPLLAETIHQDLLAFMRTVKLHQIEGASGFQHLKADLLERASVRSGGNVKMILIRTLLFE